MRQDFDDSDLDYSDDYDDSDSSPAEGHDDFDDYDSSLVEDYNGFGADSYDPLVSSTERKKRTIPRLLWITSGVVVLLLAAAVTVWLVLRSPKREEKPTTTVTIVAKASPTAAPSPTVGASPSPTPTSFQPSPAPTSVAASPVPTSVAASPIPTSVPSFSSSTLASIEAYYSYDANGNLSARVRPGGDITRYQYDPLNQLTSITYPDGSQVTYTYDEMGRRTQMVDSLGTTTYSYDLLGRLTDVTDPNGNHVGYEYDTLGNLAALVYPDGSVVRYRYDVDGRLVGVKDMSGTTTYTYDEASRLVSRTLPNGVTTSYTYDDAANRLVGISHVDSDGQMLLALEYTLDDIGNRTQVIQTTSAGEQLVTQYCYDSLSRLTGMTYPNGQEVTYTYDKVGNRLTMATVEGETQYSYNDLNQLISLITPDGSVTTFRYDRNGNLIERIAPNGTTQYTYDYENRLVRVDDGQTVIEFVYDGDGLRLAKVVNGRTTQYAQTSAVLPQVLVETTDGQTTRSLLGLLRTGEANRQGTVFHLEDGLGSVVAVTDAAGNLVGTAEYDAFGVPSEPSTLPTSFAFTGEQYDADAALLYLRTRYYDPELGRLISADPFPGYVVAPQTMNSYVYAQGNPVNLLDPLGLDAGDIYLYRDNNPIQWLIALATGGPYGHASIDLGNGLMLTAYPDRGVILEPVTELHGKRYDIYRPTISVDAARLQQVANNIISQSGGWFGGYDFSGVLLGLNPGRLFTGVECEGYCSSVVARALREVRVTSVPPERWIGRISPNDLSYIPTLRKVATVDPDGDEIGVLMPKGMDIGQTKLYNMFLPPPPPGSGGVGGVSLDRTAEVLADLNDIAGATYDPSTGQLILIGQRDLSLSPMNLDDLVVAIRSVYAGEDPGVTMVPVDPSMQDITQRVEYFGQTENTRFGWIMFEADRYLKSLAAGKDTVTGEPVVPNVPGFKSELQLSFDQRTDTPWHRNWFVPDEVVLKQSEDGRSMIFDRVAIRLESRFIQFQPDGSHIDIDIPDGSPVTDQFTAFITEHYDQFAAEKPELAELVRLAKIVGVVKWVRDNDIPVDLSWMDGYQVKYVETPLTTPGVVAEMSSSDGSYTIISFGGVDFSTENTYTGDDGGEAIALREQALASRPDDTPITWTFDQDGETYTAVALHLAPAEIIGGYTAAITDLALPVNGGMLANLTRYYNSLNLADGAMGPGWSFMPYSLSIQETAIPVSKTEYQIEQHASLTVGTRRETFAGPYRTGTGQTVLFPETPSSAYRDILLQPDGTFAVRRRDGLKIVFDSKGRLLFIEDRNGNRRSYHYDEDYPNRLVAIISEDGAGITLQYDAAGRLTEGLASNGLAVHYTYDDAGRLVGVADDSGPLVFYAYDENNLLVEIRDSENRTLLQNTYDGLGRLLSQTSAIGYGVAVAYDPSTDQITNTDPEGRQVIRLYEDGRLVSQIDPLGHTSLFEYNPGGSLASVTDPRGHTTRYRYDEFGNLVMIETPTGDRTQLFYDAETRPVWVIGPDNRMSIYEYDDLGNLARATDGLLLTSLDSDGSIRYKETAAAYSTELSYDASGNLSAITEATGNPIQMSYDSLGNMIAIQLPSGSVVQQSYDDQSRLTSITDPLGHKLTFGYDARGNLAHVSTAAGTTQYTYDNHGNLIRVADALGNTTSYGYDAVGNLVKVIEPDGAITQYEYDGRGNLTRVVDANGNVTIYSYDARGQLILVAHEDWPAVQLTGSLPEDDRAALDQVGMMLREVVGLATFDRIMVELETGTALGVTEAGELLFLSRKSGQTTQEALGQPDLALQTADLERVLRTVAAIDDGKLAVGLRPVRDDDAPLDSPLDYVWIGPDKKVLTLPEGLRGLMEDWPDRAAGDPEEMKSWLQENQGVVDELRAFVLQLMGAASLEYVVETDENLRDVVLHAYGIYPDVHSEDQIAQVLASVRQANGLDDDGTLPAGTTLHLGAVDLGDYGILMPTPSGQFLYLDAPARWADPLDFYLGGNHTIHVSRYSTIAKAEHKLAQEKQITLNDVVIRFSPHSGIDSTEAESQSQTFAQLMKEFPEVRSTDLAGNPQGAQICLDDIAADTTTVVNIEHTTAGGRAQIRDDGSFSARDIQSAQGSTSYLNCNSAACSFGDATIRAGGETVLGTTQQVTLDGNMAFVREFLTVLRQHPEGITPSEAYHIVKMKLRQRKIRGYIEQALKPHERLSIGEIAALPKL